MIDVYSLQGTYQLVARCMVRSDGWNAEGLADWCLRLLPVMPSGLAFLCAASPSCCAQGHAGMIKELDWSVDSRYLRTTCTKVMVCFCESLFGLQAANLVCVTGSITVLLPPAVVAPRCA